MTFQGLCMLMDGSIIMALHILSKQIANQTTHVNSNVKLSIYIRTSYWRHDMIFQQLDLSMLTIHRQRRQTENELVHQVQH